MKNDLFNFLVNVLQNRDDVRSLSFAPGDFDSIWYERDGTERYDDCIFSDVSDEGAIALMRLFAERKVRMFWNLNLEFAKLLALKGNLLNRELFAVLENHADVRWSEYFLHQAFYGSSKQYEEKVLSLLDEAPEDGRDGIFIACYRLNTTRIHQKLVKCFRRWMQDADWGVGTGEYQALLRFMTLWDETPGFASHKTLRVKR